MNDANAQKILTDMKGSWKELAEPVAKLVAAAGLADVKHAGNEASLDSKTCCCARRALRQIGKLPLRRLCNVVWGILGAIGTLGVRLPAGVHAGTRRAQAPPGFGRAQPAQPGGDHAPAGRNGLARRRRPDGQDDVSKDITGAIADSVNYAIDELRTLVTTINETSEQVSCRRRKPRPPPASWPNRRRRRRSASYRDLGDQPDRQLDGQRVEGLGRIGRRGRTLSADRLARRRNARTSASGHEKSALRIALREPSVWKSATSTADGNTLQRPPPLTRIFAPGLRCDSRSSVRTPPRAAKTAANRPAAPAPITTNGHAWFGSRNSTLGLLPATGRAR